MGSADEDRGALTLVASTETYTEELPRPKGESATKRAKTAKNARASTDTLDTLEPPTPEAQAQQWRTSHAFKARVRVAVYSHLVDTALFPASASSADDTLLGTQRDLFFAREDPVPLLAARSDFEQGIDDRYYTLEADQRDWAARADIVRQYAASVKQRVIHEGVRVRGALGACVSRMPADCGHGRRCRASRRARVQACFAGGVL